jgi:hypothetical protein
LAEQTHRIDIAGGSFAAPTAIRHLGKAANAKFAKRTNFGNSNEINASPLPPPVPPRARSHALPA